MHTTFTGAFQDLYPRARRLAQRILDDRTAAEDVAAEAMTRAYAHWAEIGGSVSHRTGWVLRVTTNLAIDGVRGKERPSDLAGEHLPPVADVQDGLTLRLTLTQALRQLPRRQREAVALQYLAGLTQAEVARVLEISPGSVARHVHRGLAALRAQLVEELVRGGTLRVRNLREASRMAGTARPVTAKVTGQLGRTPLYTVDIGMPAVVRLSTPEEDVLGQELECVVAEVDEERERVLVALVTGLAVEEPSDALMALSAGDVRTGTVRSVVPFGAFVDLGDEVFGLLRETGCEVGQSVDVEVVETDPARRRVSLRLTAAGSERGPDD